MALPYGFPHSAMTVFFSFSHDWPFAKHRCLVK
jgi:hypothetical protein